MPSVQTIATNCEQLLNDLDDKEFIYGLLACFEIADSAITRLKNPDVKTSYNQAKNLERERGVVLWKNKVYFEPLLKESDSEDMHRYIESLSDERSITRQTPRFIIVTDFKLLLAIDTKTGDTLDIDFSTLAQNYTFFLPWAGIEKSQVQEESMADIKAAEKMAKLFDEITSTNPDFDSHALNVFLTRLLFCFFAEDTGIFDKNIFSKSLEQLTSTDGLQPSELFVDIFAAMNDKEYRNVPSYLKNSKYHFPYVNGGLFRNDTAVPTISARAKHMILDSGSLDWAEINPDIFGSMFQAVVDTDLRGSLGMHYTSVPNIMKVVSPLFLDELYEQLEKAKAHKQSPEAQLRKLHHKLQNIRIFDPACGSGNFLIIAYKELRRLEIELFKALYEINHQQEHLSLIDVSYFYGIEIDPFAREVAVLALWLAEHQMNIEAKEKLGNAPASLPLGDAANIICDNATRVDWEEVCPKEEGTEVFILGNPPYQGSSLQDSTKKKELADVFSGIKGFKNLDYISCWFFLGTKYISGFNASLAFVSTNSITQGQQVSLLWPHILNEQTEIGFAHQSFKWTNSAKGKAGVTCVIVGLRNTSNVKKLIFDRKGFAKDVSYINAYLVESSDAYLANRRRTLSNLQAMDYGSKPADGGNLILSHQERSNTLEEFPHLKEFIRPFYGAEDYINGKLRYCLWLENADQTLLQTNSFLKRRLDGVRSMREQSTKDATREMAASPHLFAEPRHKELDVILVPIHSSERRTYIPFGYASKGAVVANSAQGIYGPEPHLFSIISSRMHMVWVRAVAGRLKTDYRYSSAICYNNFPFPPISDAEKADLTEHTYAVLDAREGYPEKTIAWMYDPDTMPADLLEAHQALDQAVEDIYIRHSKRKKPFSSNEERLEHLFQLYEKMTANEST